MCTLFYSYNLMGREHVGGLSIDEDNDKVHLKEIL
jgi:hypothetical protein